MGQITKGLRSILSNPWMYALSQELFGASKVRKHFVADFVRPRSGDHVLDIGCGPAEIIDHLPVADYWGFDISPAYIHQAQKKYGNAGHFFCKELTAEDLTALPKFDIALAIGVLHHLDDRTALTLLDLARQALKPGGRLITLDPCFEPGQNPLARIFISWDRGQNVRTREGYKALVAKIFPKHQAEVRHKKGVPYTHCFMECTQS